MRQARRKQCSGQNPQSCCPKSNTLDLGRGNLSQPLLLPKSLKKLLMHTKQVETWPKCIFLPLLFLPRPLAFSASINICSATADGASELLAHHLHQSPNSKRNDIGILVWTVQWNLCLEKYCTFEKNSHFLL